MLLGRVGQFLCRQLLQSADDAETRVARFDYIVDIAVFCCVVRVAEEVGVLFFLLCDVGLRVFLSLGFFHIKHFGSTRRTHHGDFSRWPCVVHIAAELLAAHHDVASAVALADCHSHLRHCSLAVGVEELRAVKDYGVVFLACARKESRNVDKRN